MSLSNTERVWGNESSIPGNLCGYCPPFYRQYSNITEWLEGRKEMFYLTTHSTHFIYGYMASDIWLRTIQIVRNQLPPHGLLFPINRKVFFYMHHPTDRIAHTTVFCYTSRGALAGMRNNSMGPPHEGSIRRPIAPWANALTTELHLAPLNDWSYWRLLNSAYFSVQILDNIQNVCNTLIINHVVYTMVMWKLINVILIWYAYVIVLRLIIYTWKWGAYENGMCANIDCCTYNHT